MSLLMDALRRAEASKEEAAKTGAQSTEGQLELQPIASTQSQSGLGKTLPDLETHIERLDEDLASRTFSAPPASTHPSESAEAIRNAFAVKQSLTGASKRNGLLALLSFAALITVCIVVYVWLQIDAMNARALQTPPRPPAPAPVEAQIPALPPSSATVATISPPSIAQVTSSTQVSRPPTPTQPVIGDNQPPPAVDTKIRLLRSQPSIDPLMLRAHQSPQNGELELARREFETVLQRDPKHLEALLALAAIAQHQGRKADAEQLQQRAIVANPADPMAQAAILNSQAAEADPNGTESRLKGLLSTQPEAPALNFALGNLYSRQQRWAEAQQAYFNAVASDSDNPDYLFNLAVSLDRLRQTKLAAQHYRLALDAASKRPAAFSSARVERRLTEL